MQRGKVDEKRNVIRNRIEKLVKFICKGMYEREETIAVALLAALCGQNTFLFGPPGTAKSLIARRIACAFLNPSYFEYLMNRFSTPEEVFGPVSIKALKEDHYLRKTDSYLPKAEFAFLDEIWKSSPAILNTLLTLTNERIFKNGGTVEKAPLKALIAASNETPAVNQGLDALFDRFIVRLMVSPIGEVENFERLINSRPESVEVDIPTNLRIHSGEWNEWLEEIHSVTLSSETLNIIHLIREQLALQHDTLDVYVSDRRWQRAAQLMKASAFFNGRDETNHGDALLLQHCLWTRQDNHDALSVIVANAVKSEGFDSGYNLAEIDKKKDVLESEINSELFHSKNVYKTEKSASGKEVFKIDATLYFHYWSRSYSRNHFYLPYAKMKTVETFHPIDDHGNEMQGISCVFDGQGVCKMTDNRHRTTETFEPEIIFHKGDKKNNVNHRLVTSMASSISDLKSDLSAALSSISKKLLAKESELASVFLSVEKTNLAVAGIQEQIASLKLRIKDCERLEGLCK